MYLHYPNVQTKRDPQLNSRCHFIWTPVATFRIRKVSNRTELQVNMTKTLPRSWTCVPESHQMRFLFISTGGFLMVCSPPEKPVRLQVHSCLFMLLPQCLSAPNCQIALPCISCKRTLASTMCVCVSELRLCISITFDTRLRHGSVSPISYTLQGPVMLPKRRCITLSVNQSHSTFSSVLFPFSACQ